MSGSSIGGVIGAVVGFYFGGAQGAQIGWMVGSAIGGYIDPEVIKAPGIGDAQVQTSADGIPIPVVYGAPPPFMGNLIDGEQKARKKKVETRQGKGGPIVVTEKFLLTSAVGICEGPIEGVAFIIQDGKLVYDVRATPKISPAETAKFASKIRLYTGTEVQTPDPALEAMHGVGNTPYYRGLAYMVIINDDRTATQGRVGQYAFGVIKSGTTDTVTDLTLVEPGIARFANAHWPLPDPAFQYSYQGFWVSADGAGHTSPIFEDIISVQGWAYDLDSQNGTPGDNNNSYGFPDKYIGYIATTGGSAGPYGGSAGLTLDIIEAQPDITAFDTVVLVYQWLSGTIIEDSAVNTVCTLSADTGEAFMFENGEVGFITTDVLPGYLPLAGCGGPLQTTYGVYPLSIKVIREPLVLDDPIYGDPCDLQQAVALPDSATHTIDCDGLITGFPEINLTAGFFKQLAVKDVQPVGGEDIIVQFPLGPVLELGDPDYNDEDFWTDAYQTAEAGGLMPSGYVYGVDYPSEVSEAWVSSITTTTIDPDDIFLREVQEDLAYRCDVPEDRIDADQLATDVVPGFLVAVAATGADASRQLQPVYFYDMPEEDGQIVCVKRGLPAVDTLTDDDFVDVESDDDDIRSQQVEYPKKLHLIYPDPFANYAITKQTFFRESFNVHSVDEQGVQTTIPFTRDEAAQVVDKMGKVAWASAEGRFKRTLPPEFLRLTPSDCLNYNGKRWRTELIEYMDGMVSIDAVYDRISTYQSVATGAEQRPPAGETSGLRGPTRFEFVNLSPLTDSTDKIGIYFGVCGILEGWEGAGIFVSIDAGANYTNLGTFLDASIMGYTETVLPAGSPWIFDPDATVTVKVQGGEPESTTFTELLMESNAAIIGEEVIQYQTVTELDVTTFQLTGLTRARHNTTVAEHPIHTRFCVLNRLYFIELQASWIGRNLRFYIQSIGTPDGTGYTEDYVWTPALIQTEWAPVMFDFTYDGTETTVTWVGRGRLGSNAGAFHSSYFDGYEIEFTDGATTVSYLSPTQSYIYPDAKRTADFGSLDPLDVNIYALNRITGRSEALTGTLP